MSLLEAVILVAVLMVLQIVGIALAFKEGIMLGYQRGRQDQAQWEAGQRAAAVRNRATHDLAGRQN